MTKMGRRIKIENDNYEDFVDCLKNGHIICEDIDIKQYLPKDQRQAIILTQIHENLMKITIIHTQYIGMVVKLSEKINLRDIITNDVICSFIKYFNEMEVLENLMKLKVSANHLNITELIRHMKSQIDVMCKQLEVLITIYGYLIQYLGQLNYELVKENYKK
jgi:hypothetical protein